MTNQAPTQTNEKNKFPVVKFSLDVQSTLMKEYLLKNTGLIITNYGRVGGLLRMASSDRKISEMVKDWYETNLNIGYSQIEEIIAEVETAELMSQEDDIKSEVDRPDSITIDWIVNHPVFRRLIKLIKKADNEITKAENLYYLDLIDDTQYKQLQAQVLNLLSGLLDRVIKATSPGKRIQENTNRYIATQLMNHIRSGGYRLEFFDLPSAHRDLAEEYNTRHGAMKSLLDERSAKNKLKSEAIEKTRVKSPIEEEVKTNPIADTKPIPKKQTKPKAQKMPKPKTKKMVTKVA